MLARIKFLVVGLFLLNMTSCSANVALVEYIPESVPSCVITGDEGYWKWRDALGSSSKLEADLDVIYERFRVRYSNIRAAKENTVFEGDVNQNSYFIQAMCTEKILYSTELARAMNYYGQNVTPSNLLAAMNSRLAASNIRGDDYDLTRDVFLKVIDSVLIELELRFN